MNWEDILKEDSFDFEKEMKNIFDSMKEVLSDDFSTRVKALENMSKSLHGLEYWYDSIKEKLQ